MSILKLPVLYVGRQTEQRLYTLFDSGANLSCIHPGYAEALGGVVHYDKPRRLATASIEHILVIKERVILDFYIDDVLLSDEFLVVPDLSEEVIIGVTTLQKWRIKLDFEHDRVIVNPLVSKMQI